MRYLDDGNTFFIQFAEQVHDLFALFGVEVTRRLIRQQ